MANGLTRRYAKGTDSDATDTMVAAPLTKGSAAGEGVNAPGRRQEDDVNLVSFDWQAGGGGNDESFRGKSRSYIVRKGEYAQLGRTKVDAISSNATGVRRLTPTECERLQAWPDGWTNPDGNAPDSRRYAACGDGVTATVSEWIGRRIMAAHLERVAA